MIGGDNRLTVSAGMTPALPDSSGMSYSNLDPIASSVKKVRQFVPICS